MVTIREYLQEANPDLEIEATTTQSTDNYDWEPVENFTPFTEFTWATFTSLYGDVIDHKFEAKDLPPPNKLLAIEKVISSETELDQDPLKRNIFVRVNYSLKAAYKLLRTKDSNEEFKDYPTIVCGNKEPSGGPLPDWIGKQTGFHALLCGETKLSTVFKMQEIINAPLNVSLHKPIEQCQHYCAVKGTRYGFVITDKELVVLRIREEPLGDGIAKERPRRTLAQAVRYSAGSSLASTQATSEYSNSKPKGLPKFVQYCVVAWSATDGLTVCVALFWLALMASAPMIDVDLGAQYDPFDIWVWDKNQKLYRNNTSGRMLRKLKAHHTEFIEWNEATDNDGYKYFYSYLGSTYLQQHLSADGTYYYMDNRTSICSWDRPKGLFQS